jgi:hypothetical protein
MIDVYRIGSYFPKQNYWYYHTRSIQYSDCCRKTKTILAMNPSQSPHPSRSHDQKKRIYSPHGHCVSIPASTFLHTDAYMNVVPRTTATSGNASRIGLEHHNNLQYGQSFVPIDQLSTVRYISNDANISQSGSESNASENRDPTRAGEKKEGITKFNLIETQKARAIQLWNDSNYNEALKDSVHDTVMEHLNQGMVLPIFHTLCRDPNQRLFSPNATVCVDKLDSGNIQLSSHPVKAGTAGTDTVGEISIYVDSSYIDTFFADGITARSKVNEKAFTWEFHEPYTKLVTALVNAPASIVGEDLEVTKLANFFEVDVETGVNLITRRLSRGVVAECFEASERKSIHAIAGSPGIGKSWTLIYALQQALLYENACVVLGFQKLEGKAMACIRRNNLIYVWFVEDGSLIKRFYSRVFENSNVLALLDPRDSKDGGAALGGGHRMLIMAASNNGKHFKSVPKATGLAARFLNIYTDTELKTALPYMMEGQVSQPQMISLVDTALKRAKIVGNLPRYIISEHNFLVQENHIDMAIKQIKKEDLQDILSFNGYTKTAATVPSTIFQVNVDTKARKPSALYVGIEEVTVNEAEYTDESVGYDGQLVKFYGFLVLDIISSTVYDAIITTESRKVILSFWGKLSNNGQRGKELASAVKNLFWSDLKDIRVMRLKRFQMVLTTAGENKMDLFGESKIEVFDVGNSVFRCAMDVNDLGRAVFHIKPSIQQVVCQIKKKELAFIDFAGPNCSVYQVTFRNDHDISIHDLLDLFLTSGHCVKNSNGTIEVANNAEDIGTIKYHWVVASEQKRKWEERAPKRSVKIDMEKDAFQNKISAASFESLEYCLEKYVKQYVLAIENDPVYVLKG